MPLGPGKYDDLCTYVRVTARATCGIVILLDGAAGSGFSVQGPAESVRRLPALLEDLAAQIRGDLLSGHD